MNKEIINYANLVETMIEKSLGSNDKRQGTIKCWQKKQSYFIIFKIFKNKA